MINTTLTFHIPLCNHKRRWPPLFTLTLRHASLSSSATLTYNYTHNPSICHLVNNMTSNDRIASCTGCPSQWKCRSISCQPPAVPGCTQQVLSWEHSWQHGCRRSHLPLGLTPQLTSVIKGRHITSRHYERCTGQGAWPIVSIPTKYIKSKSNSKSYLKSCHLIGIAPIPFQGCHLYRYSVSEIVRGASH
jgi:hypothetical protein